MIWYDMSWYDMICHDMIWYGVIWYDMVWYDMICHDMICYVMIWYDMLWYDMIYIGHDIHGMRSHMICGPQMGLHIIEESIHKNRINAEKESIMIHFLCRFILKHKVRDWHWIVSDYRIYLESMITCMDYKDLHTGNQNTWNVGMRIWIDNEIDSKHKAYSLAMTFALLWLLCDTLVESILWIWMIKDFYNHLFT